MKKLSLSLIIFTCICFINPVFADNDNTQPDVFVRENTQQVLDLLKKEDDNNIQKIRKEIEAFVLPKFNFEQMTKIVVGKYWEQATDKQKKELELQFQMLLTRVYTLTMSRYKLAHINIRKNVFYSTDKEGEKARVQTQVAMPDKTYAVDYDLLRKDKANAWQVYNVSVDGVSLVTTYRGQFTTEIQNNGIDGLIKVLEDKNARVSQGS